MGKNLQKRKWKHITRNEGADRAMELPGATRGSWKKGGKVVGYSPRSRNIVIREKSGAERRGKRQPETQTPRCGQPPKKKRKKKLASTCC